MAFEHSRLLAVSLAAVLLGSCSTSGNTGDSPAAPSNDTPAAQNPDPSGSSSQDPKPTLDQQRRAALVAKYLENGDQLRAEGRLDAALQELLKAQNLSPQNEQVRNMIAAVQAERGVAPGGAISFHAEQAQQREIAAERARAYVTEKLQRAAADISSENFATAVEELRQANLTIRYQNQIDWMDLATRVANSLLEAEDKLAAQDNKRQAELNEQLQTQLREQHQIDMALRRAEVNSYLNEANIAFQTKHYRRAQELSLQALELEPTNGIAQDLVNLATKAARNQASNDYYTQKAREIRSMLEQREELKIPYTEILNIDQETWAKAQLRSTERDMSVTMDPRDASVRELVRIAPVGKRSYTAETGGYLEVIKNLRLAVPEVPIIVTPQGRVVIADEDLTMQIDLVSSISLENFLNQMMSGSENLAWTVRNGVVLIGDKSEASGTIVTDVKNVQDLVFKRTVFLPPRIRDIPGSDDGGFDDSPRSGGEGDEQVSFIDLADLVENIKEATDPNYWDGDGVDITPEESGYLVVKASPEMQRHISSVLDDMRRFATPVVTIDSKFLTITRNFLQQVGVDFRGLGGAGNPGTVASLDDVTNGLQNNASRGLDNGGTGDPAANPIAGAFFNDGGDGDTRARTENYFTSSLGKVLTPNGGLTVGWTLIDDTQLNMLLRAIEKQEDAEVVNSQILSVLDRERGHVAVMNQTAYVRDFDVEVAQASFIADPKVDVIQDGIVLDVQPVIQQDRKYIILNLTPTVAQLQRPIPTFTTSLAGSTLPVTLQLPNLTVTSFDTAARVPDGGTVLLGGLRQILTKERRAEVPLLAQLPLVAFFFKQEGVSDENRSLMVMVRCWITDVRPIEGK